MSTIKGKDPFGPAPATLVGPAAPAPRLRTPVLGTTQPADGRATNARAPDSEGLVTPTIGLQAPGGSGGKWDKALSDMLRGDRRQIDAAIKALGSGRADAQVLQFTDRLASQLPRLATRLA